MLSTGVLLFYGGSAHIGQTSRKCCADAVKTKTSPTTGRIDCFSRVRTTLTKQMRSVHRTVSRIVKETTDWSVVYQDHPIPLSKVTQQDNWDPQATEFKPGGMKFRGTCGHTGVQVQYAYSRPGPGSHRENTSLGNTAQRVSRRCGESDAPRLRASPDIDRS
ncbi:hypothetical protein PCASD_03251 [Puccinia coronata f. sp. avenae]|uniref:Uncharacterized protein n=1 Tax=Puccinia coronata f. sp. avenae TaxID=200324 RepID=A0A2N5SZM7_9BASI|nr:hypothetical protein PCASD_18579 [Puccinia coronata f. sp. avenae]PLW48250.1 hypothetical protein PCASD_03251 [Puccinia coronata f. sp. avenae]